MNLDVLIRIILLGLVVIVASWLISVFLGTRQSFECEASIVVEVVNGCGLKGAAEKVARLLGDRGFDVLFVGNADDFKYDETIIVDRCGDQSKVEALALVIGTDNVVTQVRHSGFVDATVIVGRDFEELALAR